jgi:cyclic pyranopterin phosphate synthase
MGAKRTAELIPLCHPLNITHVEIAFKPIETEHRIEIEAQVRLQGKTGAEMEVLTAVAIAALTIYDMCKAVDREMVISDIHLVEKQGGKSGHFRREDMSR